MERIPENSIILGKRWPLLRKFWNIYPWFQDGHSQSLLVPGGQHLDGVCSSSSLPLPARPPEDVRPGHQPRLGEAGDSSDNNVYMWQVRHLCWSGYGLSGEIISDRNNITMLDNNWFLYKSTRHIVVAKTRWQLWHCLLMQVGCQEHNYMSITTHLFQSLIDVLRYRCFIFVKTVVEWTVSFAPTWLYSINDSSFATGEFFQIFLSTFFLNIFVKLFYYFYFFNKRFSVCEFGEF